MSSNKCPISIYEDEWEWKPEAEAMTFSVSEEEEEALKQRIKWTQGRTMWATVHIHTRKQNQIQHHQQQLTHVSNFLIQYFQLFLFFLSSLSDGARKKVIIIKF